MNSNGVNVIFRDLLLGLIGILVMAFFVVLLQVSTLKKTSEGAIPPGSVTVLMTWPEGDNDIDLWVMGPGEAYPVGYSSKSGVLFNLLRDDLGLKPDYTDVNMESAFSRGSPAGEYVINVHCYRCFTLPQVVKVEVGLNPDLKSGKGMALLATATVNLFVNGQERTAVRFKLDDNGELVKGSLNSVFMPLRDAGVRKEAPHG
jgi:hypothetical protein